MQVFTEKGLQIFQNKATVFFQTLSRYFFSNVQNVLKYAAFKLYRLFMDFYNRGPLEDLIDLRIIYVTSFSLRDTVPLRDQKRERRKSVRTMEANVEQTGIMRAGQFV